MKRVKDVDEYIEQAPKEVQAKLIQIQAIIKSIAPNAVERISYEMPYYSYKGRLAYFAYTKNHIGLYVMPPIIENHKHELKNYETAKATVRFPLNEKLPVALIKKLVKARLTKNETNVAKK